MDAERRMQSVNRPERAVGAQCRFPRVAQRALTVFSVEGNFPSGFRRGEPIVGPDENVEIFRPKERFEIIRRGAVEPHVVEHPSAMRR